MSSSPSIECDRQNYISGELFYRHQSIKNNGAKPLPGLDDNLHSFLTSSSTTSSVPKNKDTRDDADNSIPKGTPCHLIEQYHSHTSSRRDSRIRSLQLQQRRFDDMIQTHVNKSQQKSTYSKYMEENNIKQLTSRLSSLLPHSSPSSSSSSSPVAALVNEIKQRSLSELSRRRRNYKQKRKMTLDARQRLSLFSVAIGRETCGQVSLERLSPSSREFDGCRRAVVVGGFFSSSSSSSSSSPGERRMVDVVDVYEIRNRALWDNFHRQSEAATTRSKIGGSSSGGGGNNNGRRVKGLFCRISPSSLERIVVYGFCRCRGDGAGGEWMTEDTATAACHDDENDVSDNLTLSDSWFDDLKYDHGKDNTRIDDNDGSSLSSLYEDYAKRAVEGCEMPQFPSCFAKRFDLNSSGLDDNVKGCKNGDDGDDNNGDDVGFLLLSRVLLPTERVLSITGDDGDDNGLPHNVNTWPSNRDVIHSTRRDEYWIKNHHYILPEYIIHYQLKTQPIKYDLSLQSIVKEALANLTMSQDNPQHERTTNHHHPHKNTLSSMPTTPSNATMTDGIMPSPPKGKQNLSLRRRPEGIDSARHHDGGGNGDDDNNEGDYLQTLIDDANGAKDIIMDAIERSFALFRERSGE